MTIVNHEALCITANGTCICRELGAVLSAEYKKGWDDCGKFAAQQARALVRKDAMDTSRKAVQRNADVIKGTQATVYGLIKNSRNGLTDFELEDVTGIVHQSVSAARRALVVAGLIKDSGERRRNRRGNDAAVWVLASPSRLGTDDRNSDAVAGSDDAPAHTCHPSGLDYDDNCAACVAEREGGLW